MSLMAKIAWVFVGVLVALVLVGVFLGDDDSDAWTRPLLFLILFPVFLGYFYWREKRKRDDGD